MVAIVLDLLGAILGVGVRSGHADVVVGRPPASVRRSLPSSTIVVAPTTVATEARRVTRPIGTLAEPTAVLQMRQPDAQPYGAAVTFISDVAMPDGLVWILIAGSDARPGERVDRSRADAIHLLALNPRTGTGTVLGIPRDSYVEIPGHGKGKINTAMAIGGPDLLSETVQHLTGLPVQWWVVTSFTGLVAMVDALNGVVIHVERRMADHNSGAYFERGYHHLAGREVLAFSRDRHDTAQGDFSRSANQGAVVLSALRKLRVEVGDGNGVTRWARVLWDHVRVNAPFDDVVRLGSVARRFDPDRMANVVAPGEVGYAGRQSVVYLTADAQRLFDDLRDDATVGPAPAPTTTSSSTTPAPPTSTTTSTSLVP